MQVHRWRFTAFFLLLMASAIVFFPKLYGQRVYGGVAVDGVNVAGLTNQEVKTLLSLWQQSARDQRLHIVCGEKRLTLDPAEIDFAVDIDATADAAFAWGREENWWDRVKKIGQARLIGCHIPLKIRYNETKLAALVDSWRDQVERPPRNAAFSVSHDGLNPAEPGWRLDESLAKKRVLIALEHPDGGSVQLPVTPLAPQWTEEAVAATGLSELLARFTTSFVPQDVNRLTNIRLAAERINGKVLQPGETFSFNEIVGPRDKAHGFKEALEIMNNEYVPGIGGGVCQVSSTLYNAALLANLAIEERYNHSKPLGYVEMGRDATVAYGVLDFKFTNSLPDPVFITAEVTQNQLCIGLFSRQKSKTQVSLVTASREVILPGVTKKVDDQLYLGETELERQGKIGYEVTTLRIVKQDGQELKREVVSKDQYLPEDSIVRVGTRLPDFVQDREEKS